MYCKWMSYQHVVNIWHLARNLIGIGHQHMNPRRPKMRSWIQRFEAMAAAVAFAEQGEWETASTLVQDTAQKRKGETPELSKRQDRRVRTTTYRA